jgi:uncharacterized protein YprB with RNaseH-like and TPR domain
LEKSLKRRLEILKKRAKEIQALYRARHGIIDSAEDDPACTLDDAAGGEERVIDGTPFYLIRTPCEKVVDDAADLADRFGRLVDRGAWGEIAAAGLAARHAAGEFCFFDIETTGLSPNTYVFLCGMMYLDNGRFVIDQAFARDYSEEMGMLTYVGDVYRRFPVVITYNGASFDIPFVGTRMAVARLESDGPSTHVDLISPARRAFKETLPNCKLETIERHLRGVARAGDIPGAEIPGAYHDFVRTGDAARIKRILYHNRMDLIAMVSLVDHLVSQKPA